MAIRWMSVTAILGMILTGCVTSAPVKDASTKHSSNLAALQQAVGNYRKQLDIYYQRLLQQQREAHVALHVNMDVERTAKEQSASIADSIKESRDPQKPADDFITAGAKLTDSFARWADNFDVWVEKTKGDTLADRKQALKDRAQKEEKTAEELAAAGKPADSARKLAAKLREEAGKSDDELTYVEAAIELKRQLAVLDAQLNLLAAQVTTMQAFHAKINEFLSIDATIDGQKIGAAAAAGSKADISGIVPKN
ncbi:MAG TPA: hypothetical protein VFE97_03985 [Methylomirabilota bacterium]|nr:hypothetical protein [Methylomirabilota bacterium]